ncbi:MAG: ABC transporter ATP-binding protein [Atopobiaceae bacterium]|nr:ABC transporter ATP-binding protein [Atopobiaceae bacterium]
MIELTHVSKTYAGKEVKAVDDLTWTVEDGKITGFFGPNGAGKSTTLKMICGVNSVDEGTITINGHDITSDGIAAKRQFAYVPDDPDRFLRLTGIEYLTFMADVYNTPADKRGPFIEDYANRFEIYDALSSRISDYSHGMRQKVHILGALIHDPSVWILDEPMLGLDPKGAFELKEMMREHAANGHSVLFSTHVLETADQLCDSVCIISHGHKLFEGTLEQLKAQHPNMTLEEIFLKVTSDE